MHQAILPNVFYLIQTKRKSSIDVNYEIVPILYSYINQHFF
jgi:hypothetical protein